jgi:hypothetical protein
MMLALIALEVFVQAAQLDLRKGESPWNGYTATWDQEDRGMKVSAVAIDPAYERLPKLDAYGPGPALLAIDRKGGRVVVNEKLFSDLSRIDVTRDTKKHVIGTVKDKALLASPGRLAELFVVSDVIHCYAHVGASLKMVKEEDGAVYRAEFDGEHEYFTNHRHTARVHFAVEIDKKTGVVSVSTL